ncbi:hypothetical protein EC844_12270 [Acinetobacter calcoaceticus]|uniref:Uncharacterized protein n=1 Tax=Acinetobacter calcoaceticus TaxID=471 RepID=A0A4R1XJR9_ACICA|nr:hypothetical protein EC844_12270 [Acinetobacter calcoaceticus]
MQGGDSDQVSIDLGNWSNTGTQNYLGEQYTIYTSNDSSAINLWIQNNMSVI